MSYLENFTVTIHYNANTIKVEVMFLLFLILIKRIRLKYHLQTRKQSRFKYLTKLIEYMNHRCNKLYKLI